MTLMPIITPARSAFRFDQISYDSVAASLTSDYLLAVTFNPTGSKVFIATNTADQVTVLNLSTPLDITSVASTSTISLSGASTGTIVDFAFSADGLKLFILTSTAAIQEYTLSAAYGGSGTYVDALSVPGAPSETAFSFNADGTKVIVQNGNVLSEATLSTGFDVSTAGAFSTAITLGGNITAAARDFCLNREGTRMLVVNGNVNTSSPENGKVYEYSLTAFEASTATATGETYTPTADTGVQANTVDYSANGEKLFFTSAGSGAGNDTFRFSTVA